MNVNGVSYDLSRLAYGMHAKFDLCITHNQKLQSLVIYTEVDDSGPTVYVYITIYNSYRSINPKA